MPIVGQLVSYGEGEIFKAGGPPARPVREGRGGQGGEGRYSGEGMNVMERIGMESNMNVIVSGYWQYRSDHGDAGELQGGGRNASRGLQEEGQECKEPNAPVPIVVQLVSYGEEEEGQVGQEGKEPNAPLPASWCSARRDSS